MADHDFRLVRDGNGVRASVHRGPKGQGAHIVLTTALMSTSALKDPVTQLAGALEGSVHQLAGAASRYSDQGFQALNKSPLLDPIRKAYRNLRDATIKRRDELTELKASWATLRILENDPRAHLRAELRSRVAGMRPAQGVEAAYRNFDTASAISEGGEALALAMGWSPDLWSRFSDDFAERNLAQQLASQYRLSPTATDPLRAGPDHEAATVAARQHIAANGQALAEIEDVRDVLVRVVDFTAVTMDTQRDAAFEMLMTA